MQPVTLILNYKKTNSNALNMLVGAIDATPACAGIEIILAGRFDALVGAARDAVARGNKVFVGWSFYSPQFPENIAELQRVQKEFRHPDVLHIAGGVHATAEPEHLLLEGFDLIAIGEGERTLIELLLRVQRGEDYRSLRGLARLENGRLLSTGQGQRVENLDEFPPFAPQRHKFSPIEITRGCIYACQFCQTPFMFKARFRHRSIESVCEHVRMMKEKRVLDIRFITPTCMSYGSQDESVNLDKIDALLSSVRGIIGSEGRLFFGTFPSELRPEHVTRDGLRVLKRYVDNDNLIIGGQSGSQTILDSSRRGHSVESVIKAVETCREENFVPNVDFIFGLPGESNDDVEQSISVIERLTKLGARIHAHTFMPLPGTPYRKAAPGKIAESTVRRIQKLASRGQLYGQWKAQAKIAEALADI